MTREEAQMQARGAMWDAINKYVETCGGDPSKHVYGNTARQRAVVEVERAAGLTVAPPPGEIARLRGENEKLRGVRVALADLQVSVEVRDQLAAIEREVREAHAEEIASLRAEVARLRQPPPSPSREEAVERLTNMLLHAFAHGARAFGHPVAVAENEGRAMRGGVSPETLEGITDRADTILRTLGLVAVDPALVERVREARCRLDATASRPSDSPMTLADVGAIYFAEDAATRALADAVLSQLGAKP